MRTSLNDNHLAKYFTEHPNTGSMKTHICNVNKGVCLHMGNKKKKQHYASVHASGKDSRWPIYAVGNAALITCIRFWFFGNAIELPPFRTRQWVNNLSLISMWIISDSDLLGFSFILQITMKSAMSCIPIFHAMADNLFIYKIIYTFELGFHTQQCGNIM